MIERDPLAPAFEIPDLELEPAVSKRPAPVSARQPAPAAVPLVELGEMSLNDSDDDFDLIQVGPSVGMSLATEPVAVAPRTETAAWPQGRTRAIEQLPIDPAEVEIVAGYGPAPKVMLLAPLYAYRVFSRRAALNHAVAEQHAALTAAELERDTVLAQLASELRSTLEINDAFRCSFEPLHEIERLAGERSAALSQADAGFREQMARFDGELAELRRAESMARAAFDERESTRNVAENGLRRVEAKLARVQIELRGVLELARKSLGPAGGDLAPEHAAQVTELQARARAVEPGVAQAKASYDAAGAECDRARVELRRLQSQIQKLEQVKRSTENSLGAQVSVRAAGVSEAEKQRRDSLVEVARAVLAARGSVPVPTATLDALRHHDKVTDAHAVRLETHVRALGSYDRERVKLGIILVLSALGIVLLSILLKAML